MAMGRHDIDAALADVESVHTYEPDDTEMLPYHAAMKEAIT